MKKILSLLLIAFLSCFTNAHAISKSVTYTFGTNSWSATDDNGTTANWTSGKDGNAFTENQGVQITTGVSDANATSPIKFSDVTNVVVKYCTNTKKGQGTIHIQVGDNSTMDFTVTKPSSGGTTLKDAQFQPSEPQSGNVKISVDCTENSIYIYSVTVTYSEGAAVLTAPVISGVENGGVYRNSATVNISKPELATSIAYEVKKDGKTVASDAKATEGFSREFTEIGSYTVTASATDGKDSKVAEKVSFEIVFAADVTGNIVIADQKGSALWGENVNEGTLTDEFGHVFNLTCTKTTSNASYMTINTTSNPYTFRMYNNTKVTINAGDNTKMTKIEVTKSGNDKQTAAMKIDGWTVDGTTFTCNTKGGSQTITFTPTATNAWSNIKITYLHYDKVDDGAALIAMEKGKIYQVNVVLEGVKANDGVLYARTSEPSAKPSEPKKNFFDKSYEDYDWETKYDQRDWVAIEGNTELEGKTLATGFIARYDGVKLTPVAAIADNGDAASYTLNTFGVANVFYGNYKNTGTLGMKNDYRPFFVKAKVNEVAYYVGEVKEAVDGGYELWGSGVCGKLNEKGLKIEANGIEITASAKYQQIEGVLVADAEANGGVKIVALSAPTTPTGVAALKADGKATVYGTEGAVVVNGADGKVMIFDAMGRMVKSVNAEGAATVAMPAGYYIVRTAGTAAKVMVK